MLIDTNVFLIDRFFKNDANYPENKKFINNLKKSEAFISIFTLLELCGIASFNLSKTELNRWLMSFSQVYPIKVLEPTNIENINGLELFNTFISNIYNEIQNKATLLDALLIKEAKIHKINKIITWNKKHFIYQTDIKILTPFEFNYQV